MATITAADVKKLRDLTSAGMMECKKALEESEGDFDKAVELLRISGAAKAAKRGGTKTARTARSGAKATATSARNGASRTRSTAKRAATTTGRAARTAAKRTAAATR